MMEIQNHSIRIDTAVILYIILFIYFVKRNISTSLIGKSSPHMPLDPESPGPLCQGGLLIIIQQSKIYLKFNFNVVECYKEW